MKNQKVWFITGASRGFGFEIAKAAAAEIKVWEEISASTDFQRSAAPANA